VASRCRHCGRRLGKGMKECVGDVYSLFCPKRGCYHTVKESECGAITWITYRLNTTHVTSNSTLTVPQEKSHARKR
jgi:hypothetical protein